MIDTIRALLRKHRELISYVFWGGMTTVVNYVIYFLLTKGLQVYYLTSNVVAWAVSVLFAYFVNKLFVFQSKTWAWRVALRELWQIVAARVFSLGLETAILWFFVDMLHCGDITIQLTASAAVHGDTIVKLAASVVVVAVNYVLSKFIIFKQKTD